MRVFLCLLLALASLSVSIAHAQSTGSAWAVDYDRFYSVNLNTLEATFIGVVGDDAPQPMADLSGLTMTTGGDLYVASDTLKALIRIDPATGAGTLVGHFNIQQAVATDPLDFGMTAACDGSLWLSSPVSQQLWKVNPGNGHTTLVGNMGYAITGLVVDHGTLYGVGGRGQEGWYAIDTATGQGTRIGDLGASVDYVTSASPATTADGRVLAALNYVPPPPGTLVPADWSDLARIDPDSGATTLLGPITGPEGLRGIGIRGFAIGPPACAVAPPPPPPPEPQPEPASNPSAVPTLAWWSRLLLAALALAAGLVWMSRRQRPRT